MLPQIAVMGFGAFGKNHARIWSSTPGVTMAQIVDPDPERQAEARAAYPGVTVGPVLQAGPLHAATVAVPTEHHVTVAEELLARGVPCLVEKPLAATVASAERLLSASRRTGTALYVGHLERFNPAFLAARSEIDEPKFIEIHRLGSFSPRSLDIDVVLDLMVHDLDILLSLAGTFPERVEAIGVKVLTGRIDIANARLTFPGGMVANVTASRVSKERIRKLRVFQLRSYISMDFAKRSYEVYRVEPPREPGGRPEVAAREEMPQGAEPLRAELEAFLSAATGGKRPAALATGQEGAAALRLALMVVSQMAAPEAPGAPTV